MKALIQLLSELRAAQVCLWSEGEQLRYRAPRGALTAELLAELKECKAELIAFCRQTQGAQASFTLAPVARDGDLPISLAQHRLWVLDRLDGQSAAYNIPLTLRLRGNLDVAALRESFADLLRRHESLRTAIEERDGEGRAAIVAHARVPWTQVDVRHVPRESRLETVRGLAREEALRPFDLGRAPLIRIALWQLDADDCVLAIVVHHIVADGRSIEILAEEMAALYEGRCRARPASLPPLHLCYADFAWHQRRWLTQPLLKSQIAYWTDRLAGLPPLLELPADRARPPVFETACASLRHALDGRLAQRLRQLASASGVTVNTVLLAAAAALLARYSGRNDIALACPATHRDRPELQGLVGFFVNTLVLRFDLSAARSFRELLHHVREVLADAFANADVPFDKLVETLRPERNPSYPPLVQVSVAILDGDKSRLQLAGLDTDPFELDNLAARYDLTLEVYVSADSIVVYWLYATSLFDEPTVRQMAKHLDRLLSAALADPDGPLERLQMLDAEERGALLYDWNDTATPDLPPLPPIHRVVEEWAQRTPDAPALVFEGTTLTYRELDTRANRLAHRLVAAGVGPDRLVGVCLERSLDLPIALLAVLKAGGAYVPLAPAYPGERLALMLSDAQVRCLLTDSALLQRLPVDPALALCLDTERDRISAASAANPTVAVAAEHLAYVIYTSGSTGRPKGCQIEHRSLSSYLGWASRYYYPHGQGGSFGLFTSPAFDLTVTSLFLPLLRGRTLRIFAPDAALDAIFRDYLAVDSGLDSIKLTPAHISLISSLDLPATSVHVAVVGGEQLTIEQVRALRRLNAHMRIYNEYGPTEATVGCIVKEILPGETRIAIGRSIDNMRAYVLDEHLQPLPVGVPGQLYLGGAGLARGYLGRPDLDAERFVADPYARAGDARLYRSGDLARWQRGGDLECLGRADDQVKIRGFRVEPGEIESVLGEYPAVRQCAVAALDDGGQGKRLIAYVAGASLPAADVLRAYLLDRLPDYMVPAAFVALDALPLSVNGKIDRAALPPPAAPEAPAASEPPRTEIERILAEIWCGLLGLEQVGVHDNFFELGGDSILSIQAVSRAKQAGVRLAPRQFLQHPTVAALAAAAERASAPGGGPATVYAAPGPIPLTPVQHWFFAQDLAQPHHYNQSLLLEWADWADSASLEQCVRQVTAHHEALHLRFRRQEGGWVQDIPAGGGDTPFTRIDLSALRDDALAAAVEARAAQAQSELRLDENLTRVLYFDCGTERPGRLLWAIHHLAVDGVSWRILLEDLLTAYGQVRRAEPIRLPPVATAFAHWAWRLTEYADSAALREERAIWLAPERMRPPRVPLDFPGGANRRSSAGVVAVSLSQQETRWLLHEVPARYRTQIEDALLTALVCAFRDWTGDERLWVDLEGHGRADIFDDIDLSRTVGWLTAIAPVLLDLAGSADWGSSLVAVKEQLRRIPNGGLGYGVLRYLRQDADALRVLGAQPPAEVSFNYLGQLDRTLPAGGPLAPARESPGPYASPGAYRRYVLAIDGQIQDGCLQMRWQYSSGLHRRETVERVAEGFLQAVRALVAHCRSADAGAVAPSDFPLAGLDRERLSKVARLLDEAHNRGRV